MSRTLADCLVLPDAVLLMMPQSLRRNMLTNPSILSPWLALEIFRYSSVIWSWELFLWNAFADNVLTHAAVKKNTLHTWYLSTCPQTSMWLLSIIKTQHLHSLPDSHQGQKQVTPRGLSLTNDDEQGIIQEKQQGRLEVKGRQTIRSAISKDKHKNEITFNLHPKDEAKCIRVTLRSTSS